MSIWYDYYDRPAYFEGAASTFDLFGESSSFRSPTSHFGEMGYIRNRIKNNFFESNRHLKQTMKFLLENYGKIKRNKKL